MKRLKQIIAVYLTIIICCTPLGNTVLAADISSDVHSQISDGNETAQIEGNDMVGDMLATAISSEQSNAEQKNRLINAISGLEINGSTATVKVRTQVEADVVVAIYDERQIQMLASGKSKVTAGENIIQVDLTGEMPQYFIASAYLMDKESHKALCDAYTTELYTKNIQDLKRSTVDDYDKDKVLQLDEEDKKTNFAVYNEGTVIVKETASNNQMTDNGDGSYTIKNAQSELLNIKKGDTVSYQCNDETVILIKVADISVDGTNVTIWEETDSEISDYFDYIKIEADSSTGDYSVDNSNLEEGITPADLAENEEDFAESVGKIDGSVNTNIENSYNLSKQIKKVKITGNIKLKYGISVKYYFSHKYKYASVTLDYSLKAVVEISGTLPITEIPLGRISVQILPCVSVGFRPAFVTEASGKFEWDATIEGKAGGCYDSNQGFMDASSYPSCKSEAKIEGTFYVGFKATPYTSIISERLDKVVLDVQAGGEVSVKKQIYDTSEDVIHDCTNCLTGTLKTKISAKMTVNLMKGKREITSELISCEIKIGDFYWSIDRGEFGWSTCPHVCYPVGVTLKDNYGDRIKGKSILTVTDQNSGNTVEIRTKEKRGNSIEVTDLEEAKIYLPNGDYIVKAVNGGKEGKKEFSVRDRGTELTVKLRSVNVDRNISWWIENNDTLYVEGFGDMPDYEKVSGKYSMHTSAPWDGENWKDDVKIKKIVVGDGITSVGDCSFASFWCLEEVILPKDLVSIGKFAFFDCSSLKTIDIPETVTDMENAAFARCTKLVNINIPVNMVIIPDSLFAHCQNLTNLEIPSGVTAIEDSAFVDCQSLTEIKIPENVTTIGNQAFESCTSLKKIEIPANVRSIGDYAFAQNSGQRIYFRGDRPELGQFVFSASDDLVVYYPEDNSTWADIKSESFGATDIKWIPYHLASADSVSAEFDESSDVDVITEEVESEPENSDFTSDFSDSDDVESFESEIIKEHPEDDIEITMPAVENEETDFGEAEEKLVDVLETPISYAQDNTVDAGISRAFTGLIPHNRYVFVVIKSEQEDILKSSNLLYIKQKNADDAGTVSFQYMLRENFSDPVFKIYGEKPKDIKNLKAVLSETSCVYNGSARKPSVKITDGTYVLQNGTDYTVSYSKNVNAGTAVVQITGKGKYTGNKNINFSIKQASAKLEFKSSKITKKFGSALFTNGFKKKETDGKIYYSSSNTKVASVDKNKGQIKIKGVGKTTITAAANDGTNYKAGKTSFVLTVSKGNNTIQAKNIEKNMSKKAQTVNINASVKDRAKLTYTSNNKSVKVNSKGKITIAAKFTGKAIITIKAAKTARYNSTSKKITVTVKNPNINMEIFKKKSTRKWLEKMCYMRGFRDGATLKKNLGIIVRRDFLYINEEKYKKYKKNLDMLVPKKVVHDYIYDTYGIKVSKVDLPVKDGKYLLKELYWQDATEVRFDKAVKTKSGAKITLKRVLNGKSVGRNEITVKKAKNSRGFVITSIKFYKNPTVQMAKRYIGKSMNDLIMELGDANSFQYGENPDNGEAAGYYYYSKFTVLTTVNYDGSETVTDVLW